MDTQKHATDTLLKCNTGIIKAGSTGSKTGFKRFFINLDLWSYNKISPLPLSLDETSHSQIDTCVFYSNDLTPCHFIYRCFTLPLLYFMTIKTSPEGTYVFPTFHHFLIYHRRLLNALFHSLNTNFWRWVRACVCTHQAHHTHTSFLSQGERSLWFFITKWVLVTKQ